MSDAGEIHLLHSSAPSAMLRQPHGSASRN